MSNDLAQDLSGGGGGGPGAVQATTADVDLYVRDADGNDANDGSSGSPLKTLAAAVALVPTVVAHKVVIHLGDGSYPFPTISRILQAPLGIIGDGGGTGDGFTVTQAAELAAAGTSVSKIVKTGGGLTPDAFLGHTLEITAGPGAGQRAIIEENTATDFIPARNFAVAPTTASTYRLVRPAVTLDASAPASIGGTSGHLGSAGGSAPTFVMAQVRVTGSSTIDMGAQSALYGVELDGYSGLFTVTDEMAWGQDFSGIGANKLPAALFGVALDTDWSGYGLSAISGSIITLFPRATIMQGYLVSALPFTVSNIGTWAPYGGRVVVSSAGAAVTVNGAGAQFNPSGFIVEQQGAGNGLDCLQGAAAVVSASTFRGAAGKLLRSRKGGQIHVLSSMGGSSTGIVASAEGGQITFNFNPGIDGGTPGSDYSAGYATPVLAGKGAFTAAGDAISKADGSLIVMSG